jgi:antitoxin (DNA-binding transcriptional repressor) of toxin-antitoxin stability system
MISRHFEGKTMDATILDLRYRMKDVLKALERRETVRILYHGKVKGTIIPVTANPTRSVKDHPLFGSDRKNKKPVEEIMRDLRRGRYHDL